jgi:thymidylate synthase (FAD)
MLRHWTIAPQEFSQRYADVSALQYDIPMRECRLQATKNRQSSLQTDDIALKAMWEDAQAEVLKRSRLAYEWALDKGIAKEQARAVLPEGLTGSRMYVNGTLRSWITFCQVRTAPSTQKEHRDIAVQCVSVLRDVAPITVASFFGDL